MRELADANRIERFMEELGRLVRGEGRVYFTGGATDSAGLRFLLDKLGTRFKAGVVLYAGSSSLEIEERIWAVPLAGLWTG